jgi:hypothetical protein
MVTVGVGDDGAVHRLPGIDVKAAHLAVEAAISERKKGHAEK